jgi:hypothetical protein
MLNFAFLDEIKRILDNRTRLHHSQTPTVLDHSRAMPQGDGRAGPAFTRRAVGSECNLIVLDAGDVLHDAFAVRGPRIDAESKVSPECGISALYLPRLAEVRGLGFAGAWVKHSPPKRLRNASAVAVSGKQNRI